MVRAIALGLVLGFGTLATAHAQGCVRQQYIELSGKCLGGGVPYRIFFTNDCPGDLTVFLEFPRWGRGSMPIQARQSEIQYGCTDERVEVLGFCLWTDSHDKCGRGNPRSMASSPDALIKEARERLLKIEAIESEIIDYGIRNQDIADLVKQAREDVRSINRHTLSSLDTTEDLIRDELLDTPTPQGKPPLTLSRPISLGSRLSVYSAVPRLYSSYDDSISTVDERAAIPKAALIFQSNLRKLDPTAHVVGTSYQAFLDAYNERMRYDDAIVGGMERAVSALSRLEPDDPTREAARRVVRREADFIEKWSSGRGGHRAAEVATTAAANLAADRNRAIRMQAEEEGERRRAAQRRRQELKNDMGSSFDATRAEQILAPQSGYPRAKFTASDPKDKRSATPPAPRAPSSPGTPQGQKRAD